jgi:hypothetical protein
VHQKIRRPPPIDAVAIVTGLEVGATLMLPRAQVIAEHERLGSGQRVGTAHPFTTGPVE